MRICCQIPPVTALAPIQYQLPAVAGVNRLAAASGVPPVTVTSRAPRCTMTELLRNGAVSGRPPSGSTGPRNVSEKTHSSRPPGSRAE